MYIPDIGDKPGKALKIMFAYQVFRNTDMLPFGKIKTTAIIQYQDCSEIAIITIRKKKKKSMIINLKIRLPSKYFVKIGPAVFSFRKIFLSLEV